MVKVRGKKTERWSVFHKQVALIFIIMMTAAVLLTSMQLKRVSENIMEQLKQSSMQQLQRTEQNFNMLQDQLNNITLQISMNPSIIEMLKKPFDFSVYDYGQNKELMKSWVKGSSLFYSIYLSIVLSDKVLTTEEGIYDRADFFDHAVLEQLISADRGRSTSAFAVRKMPNADDIEVVTIGRAVPATEKDPLGFLVVNIRKDVFMKTLLQLDVDKTTDFIVFDAQNQLVSGDLHGLEQERLMSMIQTELKKSQLIWIEKKAFLLTSLRTVSSNWTLAYLMPLDYHATEMSAAKREAFWMLVAIAVAALIAAYLLVRFLHMPWKRLATGLKAYMLQGTEHNMDTYRMVDSAIHNVLDILKQNEPIVRDHLVHDLLNDHVAPIHERSQRLQEVGITFIYPHFVVLIIAEDNYNEVEGNSGRGLYIFSLAEKILQARFPTAGTIMEGGKTSFILNIEAGEWKDEIKEAVEDCCHRIRESILESMEVSVSFYISGIKELAEVAPAFAQVKRMMAYKALLPVADVYYVNEVMEAKAFQYPAAYQRILLNAILAGDAALAKEHVNELFDSYVLNSGYPYAKMQQMIVMLMSHVLGSLVQEGYDIAPLMEEVDLLSLQQCQNSLDLQASILAQLESMISYLEEVRVRKQGYSEIVQQALQFITDHYSESLSISDIAYAINVSHSHLSRMFKAEVGRSPLDYLTEVRIEACKTLLLDKSKSIKQICEEVGYQDVQTLIRVFKKLEGTTPGEYRKKIMN